MFKIKSLLLLILSVVASVAFAQEEEKPKLDVSGAVDLYYRYDFAKQAGNNEYTSFANDHNSFSLGMANVILSQNFGKVGFVADIAAGPRADEANGGSGSEILIKQLHVTYSPSESVTLTAGNFSTFVGYELIDANGNFNYTTSYLFSNGPFYHTGIKADFDLGSGLSAMVGVFNQTDGKDNGGIAPKFFGLQLGYAPEDSGLALYLNGLYGQTYEEKDILNATTMQVDLTGTYEPTDNLLIGLNASYKDIALSVLDTDIDGNAGGFMGVAGYLNYSISDAVALGLRGEFFEGYDLDEETTEEISDNVTAITFSANITEGNLTIIPELRYDSGSSEMFLDADAMGTTSATSAIIAAYYSF